MTSVNKTSSSSGGIYNIISTLQAFADENSDPRTHVYPLLNSLRFQLAVTSIYLFVCLYAGPKFMANRKPFKLQTTIRLYNTMQILACSYIIYQAFANKYSMKKVFSTCYPLDPNSNDQNTLNIIRLFYITYLLKLSEFIETIFFVLRKKFNQVSGLHLYHHVSTVYFVWWGTLTYPGGIAMFPIMLNCLVHIIMYTYYLVANFGPKWQALVAPVKPFITIIQMAQFTLLILMAFVLLSPYYCSEGPQGFGYAFLPNLVLVYYLFYQFFKSAYLSTGQSSKKSKGETLPATGDKEIHRKVQEHQTKNGTRKAQKSDKVA